MLDKICYISERLFTKYGIKSITMDDVAKELSISKKTIYQYVSDKNDLVGKTMLLHLQEMDLQCMKVFAGESNAILQILKIAEMMISRHKEMNPGLLFDLKKYHQETYEMFTRHRESTIKSQLVKNLELGISQGLYRQDINMEITVGFYLSLLDACLSSDISLLQSKSFQEKYHYLIIYHMHAICTPEGLKYIGQLEKAKLGTEILT